VVPVTHCACVSPPCDAYGTVIGEIWRFQTQPYLGDLDSDGDVDQEDFGRLQVCLSASEVPRLNPPCSRARLDDDDDVDTDDVTVFMSCLSGPETAPPDHCLVTGP